MINDTSILLYMIDHVHVFTIYGNDVSKPNETIFIFLNTMPLCEGSKEVVIISTHFFIFSVNFCPFQFYFIAWSQNTTKIF